MKAKLKKVLIVFLALSILFTGRTAFASDPEGESSPDTDTVTLMYKDKEYTVNVQKTGELLDTLRSARLQFITDPGEVELADVISNYSDAEFDVAWGIFMYENSKFYGNYKTSCDVISADWETQIDYETGDFHYTAFTLSCPESDQAMIESVEKKVQEALSWIPDGATDVQKAQILHDYLVRKAHYYSDDDRNKNYDHFTDDENPYIASYVLNRGGAVCNGYSRAYELLCEKAGLKCVSVESDKLNHGWNKVYIDGKWYNVDVTWDDDRIPTGNAFYNQVSHKFFLKSDAYFSKNRHGASDIKLDRDICRILADGEGYSLVNEVPAAESNYKTYDYPAYGGVNGKTIRVNPTVGFNNVSKTYKGSNVKKGKLAKTKKLNINSASLYWTGNCNVSATYKLSFVPSKAKKFVKLTSKGMMTIGKGLKKGTYKIKVKAATKTTSKYRSKSRTITVKIVVRK